MGNNPFYNLCHPDETSCAFDVFRISFMKFHLLVTLLWLGMEIRQIEVWTNERLDQQMGG